MPHLLACATLTALVTLAIAWELWLAPLRPGGSWLVLKALPLLACVPGVYRGSRKAAQWASLLVWLYVGEGAARAWTEAPPAAWLAIGEILLALAYFFSAVAWLRTSAARN